MVFTSIIFLFGFLPLVLLGNIILKKNIEILNFFLLVMSIIFYAWGGPKYILLMLFSCWVNWGLARLIDRAQKKSWRTFWGVAGVLINVGMLFVCKYLNWGIGLYNNLFDQSVDTFALRLPIGISFYTFQALSYIIDVWRGRIKVQKSLINVGLYICLFPQLVAGPIVRYVDIEQKILSRSITAEDTSDGIYRFLIGFSKKILLADSFAIIADKAFGLNGESSLGFAMAWLGAISYTLQIYYDFSGYSDMAIGLGKMLGFHFDENFNYPYMSSSISEFWRRWHISLGNWFKDYLYIPLGGNRKGKTRTVINLLITWLVTGIWHGANLTFVLWGTVYGGLIIVEKLFHIPERAEKNRIGRIAYKGFTIVAIIVCWVIFRADNITEALQYCLVMFSMKGAVGDFALAGLYFSEYMVELLLGGLFLFPVVPAIKKKSNRYIDVGINIALYVCFAVSISYLVKGAYSPFIYFNF